MMVEQQQGFFFDHQEVVTDLIKKQNLHEGRWKLTLELGLSGQSLPVKKSDGSRMLLPAGLVLVQRIGITRTEEVDNLTVDAAEVNPAPATRKRSEGSKKATKRAVKK